MKAIEITKPFEIRITEKEKPIPKQGEALLQVLCCGICGADLASFTGNQPFTTYPRIPGHEFSARIVEIPENDKGFKAGDIITCNPYFNCGECYACKRGIVNACHDNQTMGVQRDGSFQEYVTMPIERIIDGKGLSAEQLALIEPFSISCHALSRIEVKEGDNLLIMGAGPIGLFALIRAKSLGARVAVADLLESRLELAKEYGADLVINSKTMNFDSECKAFTNGQGFDDCVEACGAPETFLACIEQAAHGANIVLIGNGKRETTFVHSIILKKELNIFGSRNSFTKDFETLISLVASGKVDITKMITKIYNADDVAEAFDSLKNNDGSINKLLIRF